MMFWRVFMRISYTCPAHLKFSLTVEQWTKLMRLTDEAIHWLDAHEEMYDVWLLVAYATTSCALVQVSSLLKDLVFTDIQFQSTTLGYVERTLGLLICCEHCETVSEGGRKLSIRNICQPDARSVVPLCSRIYGPILGVLYLLRRRRLSRYCMRQRRGQFSLQKSRRSTQLVV